MQAYTPTTIEKIRTLNDGFRYEVEMVYLTVRLRKALYSKGGIDQAQLLNNMFIESVTLHTRVLLEFFRNNRKHPNDVKAGDFMKANETWTEPNIDTDSRYRNLKQVKDRVNEELAHLSYGRVIQKKTQWDLDAILKELSQILNEFLSKCNNQYIEADLRGLFKDFVK